MPATKYAPQCYIKIGGSQVSEEFMKDLIEVVVDDSLYLPSMFTIEVNDPELAWANDTSLDIGKPVEIAFEQPAADEWGGAVRETVIQGEITSLEPDFSAGGKSRMLLRGYDKSHRLHRGKQTRTFLRQKYDAIVRKIAGEAGLSSEIDATSVTHDWVIQNNQTNMEFLTVLADRVGYQVFAAQGKLYFKKGDTTLGDGPTLKLGDNLLRFRPRATSAHQADKVTVRGWDGKGKEAITVNATPSSSLNQGGMTKTGGAIAKGAFGGAELVVTRFPIFTADEATALAIALSQDVAREFVEAEGECDGHPQVLAGYNITIEGVGERFSGKYYVTSATHVYNRRGYRTTFGISGRQPNTLSHLLGAGNGHGASEGTVRGVVNGLVTNIVDPDNLGRVKVKYAWLGDIESDWIRIANPMGGPERGFMYLPEVNDEVLLAFQHGDPRHPYVVGALWNSRDKPPKPTSEVIGDGKVNERILKSRSGHIIILDDTDGAEKIIIRDKTESNEMIIDSTENSMTINVDGDFKVVAKGKITLESTQDMSFKTKANGTIETTGDYKISVTKNLTAEAKMNASMKGLQLALEGKTKAEFKGLTVSVNGSTLTEVKGALVKIN